MINLKMKDIYETASRLFINQGYSRTKISHIAKDIGVSVGTIYSLFESKQEIMYFVLKGTIDPDYLEKEFELPVSHMEYIGIESELINAFQEIGNEFAKNIDDENYTYENMLSDAFDVVSKYAAGCLFIENNQNEIPALTEYYRVYRKRFFETIQGYMTKFIENGTVREVDYLEYTVILIIETLCTWGMDIRYHLFERPDIDQNLAKTVCLDNLISAYKI